MSDKLLTQKEVAQMLGVCLKTIQTLRRERRLAFERFGYRTIRIPESSVLKFKAEAHYEAK